MGQGRCLEAPEQRPGSPFFFREAIFTIELSMITWPPDNRTPVLFLHVVAECMPRRVEPPRRRVPLTSALALLPPACCILGMATEAAAM
jgi:hypothetical protein